MAVVKFMTGIDYVKGSLAKPKKTDGHSHGSYLIGTHREAATTNPNCTRLYIRRLDAYNRSTPFSADELAAQNKFGEIAAAVAARRKDLTKIAADNAAFKAQKDEPNGKKTMRSYLWSLEKAAWEQANG
ncbi:MAG: hypothetical protein J6T80_02170 [Paludibacteraceae bacterium]|nr:hypothetical protein [Paludibacteraceae bacterium]